MKIGDLVRTKGNNGALWLVVGTSDSRTLNVRVQSVTTGYRVWITISQLEVISASR